MRSLSSSVETSKTKTGATLTGATLAASFMAGVSGYEIDLARLGTVAADMNYTWAALAQPDVARLVVDGLKIMATQAPGLTVMLPNSLGVEMVKEEEGGDSIRHNWTDFYTRLATDVYMNPLLQKELVGVIRDFVIALENLDIKTGDAETDAEHQTRIDWKHRCDALLAENRPSLALNTLYLLCPFKRGVDTLDALAAAYYRAYECLSVGGQKWTFPTFRLSCDWYGPPHYTIFEDGSC